MASGHKWHDSQVFLRRLLLQGASLLVDSRQERTEEEESYGDGGGQPAAAEGLLYSVAGGVRDYVFSVVSRSSCCRGGFRAAAHPKATFWRERRFLEERRRQQLPAGDLPSHRAPAHGVLPQRHWVMGCWLSGQAWIATCPRGTPGPTTLRVRCRAGGSSNDKEHFLGKRLHHPGHKLISRLLLKSAGLTVHLDGLFRGFSRVGFHRMSWP